MFALRIISGPGAGQSIKLVYGAELTIGRGYATSVRLDDASLADVHAEVSWTEMGFSVIDLSTSTGTFVNETRIRNRHALRVGDRLRLGEVRFELRETPDVPGRSAAAPSRTPAVFAGKTVELAESFADAPTVDGYVESRANALRALVSSPASVGAAKMLVSRDQRIDGFKVLPLTIGRDASCNIVLDDSGVSGRHAELDALDGRYVLRDAGSSNGTFVNNQRVAEQAIHDGDVIGVGAHNLVAVLGSVCLGIEVQAPSPAGPRAVPLDRPPAVHRAPPPRKRARVALVALLIGVLAMAWMLIRFGTEIFTRV